MLRNLQGHLRGAYGSIRQACVLQDRLCLSDVFSGNFSNDNQCLYSGLRNAGVGYTRKDQNLPNRLGNAGVDHTRKSQNLARYLRNTGVRIAALL